MSAALLSAALWAITPEALTQLQSHAPTTAVPQAGMWEDYCERAADERVGAQFDAGTGILIQPVRGVLLRGCPAEYEAFYDVMDSSRIDQAAAFAAADSRVKALVFLVDSPGGYTSGMSATTGALAALHAARPDLPIASYVEGECCSLAYIFANAAGPIKPATASIIGCIGVMAVTTDSSKYYEALGIERRLFADGKYKGMGSAGVKWKAEWYDSVQASIDTASAELRADIIAKRPAVTVDDMQGQYWEAQKAPPALHDGIPSESSFESWIAALAKTL